VKLVPLTSVTDTAEPSHNIADITTLHSATAAFQHREYGAGVHATVMSPSATALTAISKGASGGIVPADAQGVTELDWALSPPCMPDALVADTKNEYDMLDDSPDTVVDSTAPVGDLAVDSNDTGTVMLYSLPSDASTTMVYDVTGMVRQGTVLVQVRFTHSTSAMATTVTGADGGNSVQ
jgi:hypothetical protein